MEPTQHIRRSSPPPTASSSCTSTCAPDCHAAASAGSGRSCLGRLRTSAPWWSAPGLSAGRKEVMSLVGPQAV